MAPNVEKDRYLQLDGTPVESREWRRYVTPWTLAAAFTGTLLGSVLTSKMEDAPPIREFFTFATLGLIVSGTIRKALISDFTHDEVQDYVIDTKSENQKHTCTEEELNRILRGTKISAYMNATVNIGLTAYKFATMPAITALAHQLPFLPSPLVHSYEGFYLANKLEKKEWVVVGRMEMQEQEMPAAKTNLEAQPS